MGYDYDGERRLLILAGGFLIAGVAGLFGGCYAMNHDKIRLVEMEKPRGSLSQEERVSLEQRAAGWADTDGGGDLSVKENANLLRRAGYFGPGRIFYAIPEELDFKEFSNNQLRIASASYSSEAEARKD